MMNKKFPIYSLVALLSGSTITTVSLTDLASAQQQTQAPRPANQSPMMQGGMEMKTKQVDQAFIEMMIPHHQGATEMAEMALNRSKNPQVRKLAEAIIKAQTPETKQMQTWYKQWYGTEPNHGMNMGMHNGTGKEMMMSMQRRDMMNMDMTSALKNTSNFDQEFLTQMIRHHQSATMMAGLVVNSAEHPEIRNLAQNIIQGQTAEIAQMRQLLTQQARK